MNIYYDEVIRAIVDSNNKVVKATKYVSPKFIIRATRTLFSKKIVKGNIEISLTIGRPNYAEREFIKDCKKFYRSFPIEEIQLKMYNPKPKKLTRKNRR